MSVNRDLTLSIIIPIYNEAESLREIINELKIIFSQKNLGFELICIDDGSTDDSLKILKEIEGVKLISYFRNRGYGATLKAGFNKAAGSLIAFIDADSTYLPIELWVLVESLINDEDSLVFIGSRFLKKNNTMKSLNRWGNILFAKLISLLFGTKITDACSGMRVFRRGLLDLIDYTSLSDDLDFSPQFTIRCLKKKIKIKELPIGCFKRKGSSKIRILKHSLKFLMSILK